MLNDLLGFVIALVFGAWLLSFVIGGIRRGRIQHTDSTSTYSFKGQPRRFIAVALLFCVFASMFWFYAAERALALWRLLAV